ncbi:MAG TPA: YdbH domain-containing protein [Pseudomonadales bacterium]|nr:YdbH domain-containing protein [Pseudomonadales bacterium]
MRSATRLAGRAIGLLAIAALALLLLWALSPWLAAPLAQRAVQDLGVSITAIEIERPRLDGIRIERLALRLASPETQVHIDDLAIAWCLRCAGARSLLDGHLTQVSARRIAVRVDRSPAADPAAAATPATPDLASLLPGALRALLPVERLHVEHIDLDVRSAEGALTGNGSVDVTADAVAIRGTLESVALQRPVHLTLQATQGNALALTLTDPDGRLLIDLDGDLEGDAERLTLRGRMNFDTATLGPMLGLELPPVIGDLRGALDIDPTRLRLTLEPGTALGANLALAQGSLGVAIRPRTAFVLTLAEDRFTSAGVLPLDFALAGAATVDGRLQLQGLEGSGETVAATVAGSGTARQGAIAATWTLASRVASSSAGRLTLDAIRLQLDALELGGDRRLDRVVLTSAGTLSLDPQGPRVDAAPIELSAGHLQLDGRRLDLTGRRLTLRPTLREGRVATDFRLEGAGLEAGGSISHDLDDGTSLLRLRDASASLAPGDLLAAVLGPLISDALGPAWPVRRGRLGLSGRLSWPLQATAGVDLAVTLADTSLDADLPQGGARVNLDGIDFATTLTGGRARLDLGNLDLGVATAEYRATAGAEPARAAGITLDAALSLSAADLFATDGLPALKVESLDLRVLRVVVAGYGVDRLRATGSGHHDEQGVALAGRLLAAGADAGVAFTDLACDLALDDEALTLGNCGGAVLGGRVTTPAARVDLATLDAYVPIAMLGLDLGASLALMQDAALDGTGTLDGAVPLRLRQGKVSIEDGYVAARAPGGSLRYATDASLRARLGQPGLALALDALQDFRFARLGSTIDYGEDGTLDLGVSLAGASPRVENGRAINFNLEVTQNLPLLLQSLRLSQNIGDTVERRLQERFAPR